MTATLRPIVGGKTKAPGVRELCEASYRSAWMFVSKFELRLNASSMAGMLLVTCGDARRALSFVEGNSDMAVVVRRYLNQVIEEERTR